MNFIYDVVLNFNKDLYEFYEWDKKDSILNIKKIPLFLVNNDIFKTIKYSKVTLDKSFVNIIKDKTYTYNRIKIGNACLLSNGKAVIGILLDNNGVVIKKSSLLLDEEEEVLDEVLDNDLFEIKIIDKKKINIETGNRIERDKKNFLIRYINKENNNANLKFLYYDYFEKEEDNISTIKNSLIKEIKNNYNKKINNLYDTAKLFIKIKN